MKKNKNRSGTIWGTILGTSIGLMVGSQMTPINKRKIMRAARKTTENIKDMMD